MTLQEVVQTARELVLSTFPSCEAAFLAGSVVRGEATKTSDLDIVVFDLSVSTSYRESFIYKGWPVEWYVHNLESYQFFYEDDCKRARPSLPKMVSEGILLQDTGSGVRLQEEAKSLLLKGPEKWGEETIVMKRYFLTDVLDDFIGATNRGEELFCAATLAEQLHEFVLRTNNQWIGSSKWIVLALKEYDPKFAEEFVKVFDHYYGTREKEAVILLVDRVLAPFGGRLFEGFSLGKK
ncbi:nucleotidyltransferase domain-containing protein [Pseudalkalibacillus hwajinpoensis]|uniref:Nucleotidyltransferase domain-containing protein n=1 Tax=Guptibacillus hwajinpoensis TaxID=208199 RepID=A0A4U1MHS5_9BACL|nr:nucleotidyltransferase domain-containing protein [Pseudalkalibacillus hwajinpoensis]TKD69992.1 nucleotidyltransferase domain-containing protein [Pseudalkalibacillus hwajinpoensis]